MPEGTESQYKYTDYCMEKYRKKVGFAAWNVQCSFQETNWITKEAQAGCTLEEAIYW